MTSDGPADEPEGAEGSDPFEELSLDESFVRGAAFHEPSASDRVRPESPRSGRPSPHPPPYDDDLTRRLAPDGWDDEFDADEEPSVRRHSPAVRVVALVMVIAFVTTYLGVHLLTIFG